MYLFTRLRGYLNRERRGDERRCSFDRETGEAQRIILSLDINEFVYGSCGLT